MEKELNIAAILKEKPKGLKLWSPIFGECEVRHINDDIDDSISVVSTYSLNSYEFIKDGRASEKGVMCLFPSKVMQDWSKFAWKKGDVLINGCGFQCIFKEWASNDYTKFNGCYSSSRDGYEDVPNADTMKFQKVDNNIAYGYIREIERKLGGALNLETLQIEKPKQEFKDGDVVYSEGTEHEVSSIFIVQDMGNYLSAYILLREDNLLAISENSLGLGLIDSKMRLATDSEKQQLFSALEKEGKAWDAEKKAIVDLPKKCEFKPMDLCLMRDRGEKWKLCQFGFFNKGDGYEDSYNAVGGNWYDECIPYNDSTKHLLGTTDEWKGGNE